MQPVQAPASSLLPLGRAAVTGIAIVLLSSTGFAQEPESSEAGSAAPEPVVDEWLSELDHPHPLVEPHLSISPVDPDHRLVVAMSVEEVRWDEAFAISCIAWASRDGGHSWRRTDFPVRECGDPWSAIRADGESWVVMLGAIGEESGLVAYRSGDGGFTWDEPRLIEGPFDHPFLVSDPRGDEILAVSALFRRSADGETLSGTWVAELEPGGDISERGFDVPARGSQEPVDGELLADGTLVVVWAEHSGPAFRRKIDNELRASISSDGGRSFGPSGTAAELCSEGRPNSWPQLTRAAGPDGSPILMLTCEAEDFAGVLVHRSIDGGRTWSPAETVRPDADPRHPWVKTPAAAGAPDGRFGLVWYDGRAGSFHQCHVLVAVISDTGGDGWSDETIVSTEPSCPYSDANGDAAWRWPGGGDYIGMAATEDRWVVVWPDARDGLWRLRMTELQ